jgi:poly(A) polymerase
MSNAIQIPPPSWLQQSPVRALIAAFAAVGSPLRFVGGCVRDSLLDRPVKDIDAATPAIPPQVITLLEKSGIKAIPTGIAHGTVTAVIENKHVEITTLRRDAQCDGRHASVEFSDDWREDAARRDFTMNALYLSPQGELFDYFGGLDDARHGRVRFIGEPASRIREDGLRVLRFFRFYAWFGRGAPDAAALEACVAERGMIKRLSGERIQKEMLTLLAAPGPVPALRAMQETGVLAEVMLAPLSFSALADRRSNVLRWLNVGGCLQVRHCACASWHRLKSAETFPKKSERKSCAG